VESVRRAVDAFNRRDSATWLALCDPDIEWRPLAEWPESAPIRGAEAVFANAPKPSKPPGFRSQRRRKRFAGHVDVAADGVGSARVGEGAVGLLGGDNRDGEAERLHPVGEIAAEPARDPRRKGGDDDLVEPASLDRLLHGDEGIGVPDDPFDVATSGLGQQRDGQLECGRGRVGFRVPVGTRHDQRERAGRPPRAGTDLIEQSRSRRGLVSHDQNARRRWGRHRVVILASLR
jgi:hypothetical protein